MNDYWKVQKTDDPLYPDLIWSRPENKNQAGKLLIVGGSAQGINGVASAYDAANKAGAGSIKVALPDSIQSKIKALIPEAEFCPSTPSGSFARSSLSELLDFSSWSDMVLLPGDLGKNSETAILLETFVSKFKGSICLTEDAVEYFINNATPLINRGKTLVVASMSQLQKISLKINPKFLVSHKMELMNLAESLHQLTLSSPLAFVVKQDDYVIASYKGQISTTKVGGLLTVRLIDLAAFCSVFWMQNVDQAFESITTGIYVLFENKQ